MLLSPIREAISSIKKAIRDIYSTSDTTGQNRIVYDIEPILELTKQTVELLERNAVPKFDIEEIQATDPSTSQYINNMTSTLYRILRLSNISLDEITNNANTLIIRLADELNQIEPILEQFEIDINDIEDQVLEKITNRSIFNHEIKNINFSKNILQTNCNYEFNILLLPIVSSTILTPVSHSISINASPEAKVRLDGNINAGFEKDDADIMQGTYFGNMVDNLDGTGSFLAQRDMNINDIHNTNFNAAMLANYYSLINNDKLDITVKNIFNRKVDFNFLAIKSNVDPKISVNLDGNPTGIKLINNVWTSKSTTDAIHVRLIQETPKILEYQGIDIIEGDTIIKRHNYFNSLNYKFPDVLSSLNSNIKTEKITPTPTNRVVETARHGFYKYPIELEQVDIRFNTYANRGWWESERIITEGRIESVELEADMFIPNDEIEYVQFHISFNQNTWFPIRCKNRGTNVFTSNKKSRIVLNTNNDDDDFLFIGKQDQDIGLYLRVDMATVSSDISPAIYNLKLRIKVKDDEEL